MTRFVVFPLWAAVLVLGVARGDDNPALKKAREDYVKAIKDADAKLVQKFEKAIDQVPNMKLAADKKVELQDVLKAEKKRFEEDGLIPWSQPMWSYVEIYLQSVHSAQAQLRKSYNVEIDKAVKAKNEAAARDLVAELNSTLDIKPVARWEHHVGNDERGTNILYSNGTSNNKDSKNTWTFNKNGVLVMKWPNTQAPGGAWIDTVQVGPYGKGYSGRNQNKTTITGKYVRN